MKPNRLAYLITLMLGISSLIFTSCDEKKAKDGNITISGQVEFPDDDNMDVVLSKVVGMAPVEVGRSTLVDGKFTMEIKAGEKDFYVLNVCNRQERTLILGDQDVTIETDGVSHSGNFKITGSPDSNVLLAHNDLQSGFEKQVEDMRKKYQAAALEDRAAIEEDFAKLAPSFTAKTKSFIDENSSSLAVIVPAMGLSIDDEYEYLTDLTGKLFTNFPNNELVKNLKDRVDAVKNTAIGMEAPEIELENPEGGMVALSSLKGKYVLIDFWASWCGPCRSENPNVVRLYDQYKEKGFEIFGVSLDRTKDDWVKAIADDQLSWVHVSDLKFWNSSVVPLYNISGIPMTVLLDKEGKIIAKGLRGKQLEDKLAELL